MIVVGGSPLATSVSYANRGATTGKDRFDAYSSGYEAF